MDFNFRIFIEALPALLVGARNTLVLSVTAIVLATLLGLVGGLARTWGNSYLTAVMVAYVTLIRGTPLLVLLLFAYYGLPSMGVLLEAYTVGVLVLAINHGAFISEIFRAGIQSIERGQHLATRALGMSKWQTMAFIIVPQAIRRILPPLTNESINLLKNSALASTIAVTELLRAGLEVMTWKANTFSPFFGVALIYLLLTLPMVWLSNFLERRYAVIT
jgi:His/Glu/Gln/Arg/opine family amino acid ABC transporter permease subunit